MKELIDYLRQTITPQQSELLEIEGVPHLIIPDNCTAQALPELLERKAPERIRRSFKAHDVRGLIDYCNVFGNLLTGSRIYADSADKPRLKAVLDDHPTRTDPSHCTHSAEYPCPYTAEWLAWTKADRRVFNQVEFAEFIEANIRDIHTPSGTELLTATLNFSQSGAAEFSSAVRLNDGSVQFKWVDDNKQEQTRFPERLTLGLPVFEGIDHRYQIEARVRYRIDKNKGALSIWYELDRPDLILRAAYDHLLGHVAEATGLPVYRGMV